MSLIHDGPISDKECQLIQKRLLGRPLKIYGISWRWLLFIRIASLLVVTNCIFCVFVLINNGPFPWPITFLSYSFEAIFFLPGVGFALIAILPRIYQDSLYICEKGVLGVLKILWIWKTVRVIYWKDIRNIRGPFYPWKEYSIEYGKKSSSGISAFQYLAIDEIILSIREKMSEMEKRS